MKVLLVGGYFKSGKTTLLTQLIRELQAGGKRLCVLVNSGEIPAFPGLTVETVPMTGGCVCCQATNSLIGAIRTLESQHRMDWVLVELSGAALLASLRETVAGYVGCPVMTLAAADAGRWQKLLKAAKPLIVQQIQGADIVAITKTDLNPDLEPVEREIQSIHPDCVLLRTYRGTVADGALTKILMQAMR